MSTSTQALAYKIAIVHDVDGVHTDEYHAPQDFNDYFDRAFSEATNIVLPAVDAHAAKRAARDSYNQYGNSITGLSKLAEQHGIPPREFLDQVFEMAHQILFHTIKTEFPHFTASCNDTIASLDRLNGSMRHGVATHSSLQHWTMPLFEEKGILTFFNASAMIDHKAVGFVNKSNNPRAVQMALEKLGVHASQAIFMEDSTRNLRVAKEAMPGLTTVLITHGRPATREPHIDFVHETPLTLFLQIEAERRRQGVHGHTYPAL